MQWNELKNIKRIKEIATILIKYGFEEVVQRLEIPGIDLVRKKSELQNDVGIYDRFRRAIEELGPTFIKFGQILSLRPDLLPQELLDELGKLQDDVSSLSLDDIQKVIIEKEIGGARVSMC